MLGTGDWEGGRAAIGGACWAVVAEREEGRGSYRRCTPPGGVVKGVCWAALDRSIFRGGHPHPLEWHGEDLSSLNVLDGGDEVPVWQSKLRLPLRPCPVLHSLLLHRSDPAYLG